MLHTTLGRSRINMGSNTVVCSLHGCYALERLYTIAEACAYHWSQPKRQRRWHFHQGALFSRLYLIGLWFRPG